MQIVRFQSSYAEPYPLQIVGEASYRDEIEEVTGYAGEEEGINADDFIAHLILDDMNIYDRGNAVAVEIDGQTVGYLSKQNAKRYRQRLTTLELAGVVGECYASIRGGFIKRSGEQADFGVRLDLDLETFVKLKPRPQPKPEPAAPIVNTSQTPAPAVKQSNSSKISLNTILDYFTDSSKDLVTRIFMFLILVTIIAGVILAILQSLGLLLYQ
jgi:hypothetical protein